MTDCKLSIIVPVYNVEQTLERCVDSLIDQDLDVESYEIIMVNDGSIDQSQTIANMLVGKYPNVLLFNQENQGLSGARNTGMQNARGKYLMFVDSDDYIATNCLKKLVDTCEKHSLEVCHFSLTSVREKGNFRGSIGSLKTDTIYSGYDILLDGRLIGSACSNLYLRSFMDKYQLMFYRGITHEDVEFSMRLYCHVKRVLIIKDEIYFYTYNTSSLSKDRRNIEKENKYVCDAAVIGRLSKEYVQQHVKDERIKDLVIRRVNTSVVANLYTLLKQKSRPALVVENLIDAYRENGLFPIWGKCLNWKSRLMGFVFCNAYLYKKIYRFKRRKFEF